MANVINKTSRQIKRMQTEALHKVGQQQVQAVQDRIRSSKVGPDGKAWRPWSLSTLRQRTKEGTAGLGLLYRTGALLNSIQYKVSKGVLTVFTNMHYGKFLQFGTRKMPARPFIGWGNELNNIINTLKEAMK